ncbi:Zn-dependent hydrolase [Acidocella sp.]|jgi:N-carbamoyl-L-amino-acid hydrolase|uniref:Zn-dependent hydrolase n=1 Tax=Acidocella sp. TaxID=50710 RepID=UPI002F422BD6
MTARTNQRIDGARLWDTLMEIAKIGATPKGGVKRITLSAEDRQGRQLFQGWCEAVGLKVRVDSMGNMFARREGRDATRPPVLLGSHLDSQPTGGKFDGALGVIAGLEVMRTLHDLHIVTEAPIELVNWTDEEGCRFGRAMMGSAVWAGLAAEETIKALKDEEGITVAEALQKIGFTGAELCAAFPADALFELHIEQGPMLEAEQKKIGIVTGAQAQIWFDAEVTGYDSHAGTTPAVVRKDALLTAARIVDLVDAIMREEGDTSMTDPGRGTVGRFNVYPNSPNVIPGRVRFSVEFRNVSEQRISDIAETFPARAKALAEANHTELTMTPIFRVPAQPFDPECVSLVEQAAAKLGYPARRMVSGAGHDAVHTAMRIPTAMIFTPCKNGLSHNEAESIEPDEAEAGTQVLFEAVLARANRVI